MFSIKNFTVLLLITVFISGCSHRIQRKGYFQKHDNQRQVNQFDPRHADKSKKVKLNDESIVNGEEPDVKSTFQAKGDKKHPTMRSYEVNGVRYYPSVVEVGSEYTGISSWYGPDFNGKQTSNGEYYDMYAFTAAHKTFPMHTIVRVTNLDNHKQVTVRVNDRGPFVKNRIIDLSKAAARKIGMTQKGTARVRLEVLGFNDIRTKSRRSADITPRTKQLGNFYVQIGSFRSFEGAKQYQERFTLVNEGSYSAIIKNVQIKGSTYFKVLLSGFNSESEARNYIQNNSGFENAFIIRD